MTIPNVRDLCGPVWYRGEWKENSLCKSFNVKRVQIRLCFRSSSDKFSFLLCRGTRLSFFWRFIGENRPSLLERLQLKIVNTENTVVLLLTFDPMRRYLSSTKTSGVGGCDFSRRAKPPTSFFYYLLYHSKSVILLFIHILQSPLDPPLFPLPPPPLSRPDPLLTKTDLGDRTRTQRDVVLTRYGFSVSQPCFSLSWSVHWQSV